MKFRRSILASTICCLLLFILGFSCQKSAPENDTAQSKLPDKVDFNFHIKPLISDRCFACHGPDEKTRKGNLRLDTPEGAFALVDTSENRFAIVPGNLKKSHLISRIESQDPSYQMPPPESNLHLSEYEIKLFKKWISQGAEWKDHWAFIPPQKGKLPDIKNKNWPKNEIDHFTLAKMQEKGLKANSEAPKEKLIRRLYFDLTGLPPDNKAINAFMEDDSPQAYEKLVDDLLAQKSYGERMAMEWMDLARYADSHGYQDDIERSMWPWREWVIDAFNQNLAYNQFVSWQIGGDLLPNASYEQKLATGFNRNHKITQEVGVIDEEYRVTYVLDRVNTFSTAFLGLTAECAQCHDHKYDPISQKEYYQMFSFFNSIPEKGRVEYNVEVAEPSLALPEEKIEKVKSFINGLYDNSKEKVQNHIEKKWSSDFDIAAVKLNPGNNTSLPSALIASYPMDYIEGNQLEEAISLKKGETKGNLLQTAGKFSGAIEFMGKNHVILPTIPQLNLNKAFSIAFWLKSQDDGINGPILTLQNKPKGPYALYLQTSFEKGLSVRLKNGPKDIFFKTRPVIPPNRWVHIAITYDASKKSKGLQVYFDGERIDKIPISDKLSGTFPKMEEVYLGSYNATKPALRAAVMDELQFYSVELSQEQLKALIDFNPLIALKEKKTLKDNEKKRLFYHHLHREDIEFQSLIQRWKEYRIRQSRMEDILLKPTMVMADMDTMRPAYILDRGQYDQRKEEVTPGTPEAVLAFNKQYAPNRLGLSEWLFAPENPLSARVAVNRYWQMIFGKGIVSTPGDFGSQGNLPTHPELLDWLAVDFQESAWDLKALIKKMVMSATYRQAVDTDPIQQSKDPDNIYLARGPQSRLSAEMVRDHALAISGLLSKEIGGPSVKPYQPKGLWLEMATGNQSLRKYIQDHGHELYRRSLYSFWKRTVPPPSMVIFDAPSREQCSIKRRATSTPMQALVLLNDPQFIEASRLIATRMIMEGGSNPKERIQFAFQLATSRKPNKEELKNLSELLEKEFAHFEKNEDAAEKLINIGEYPVPVDMDRTELASYTVLANTILNLTESIQKG